MLLIRKIPFILQEISSFEREIRSSNSFFFKKVLFVRVFRSVRSLQRYILINLSQGYLSGITK